jgi:hypothetical protein
MHPLDGAFLKLRWANYHLHTLQQAIQSWRNHNPYEIVGNMIREGDVRKYRLTAKENIPFHTDFSLMVGDVCGNARSALDHLLWQLWLLKDPAFDRNVYFPVFDTFDAGDGQHGFKFQATRHIRDLTKNQRTLIENSQPYHTGYEALNILRDLNNSDKHRVIQLFALTATSEIFEILTPGGGQPTVGWIKYRIAERVAVKDGAIMAEIEFPPDFIGNEVGVNADFSFTSAFNDSKTAHGLNVDTTLQNCLAAIHYVLLKFEGEFPGTSTVKG